MARFFISYTQSDLAWAERIAGYLRKAEHEPVLQARDFRPGDDFIAKIIQEINSADLVIAVLSNAYLESEWAQREMRSALHQNILVPVRIQNVAYVPLLSEIIHIDMVNLVEPAARDHFFREVELALERLIRPVGEHPPVAPSPPASLNAEIKSQRLDTQIPERSVLLPDGSKMDPGLPPDFVNRQSLLRDLAKLLRAGSTTGSARVPTVVLTGRSGIGKTYLAQEFVYRYGKDEYFKGGVFWLDFSKRGTVDFQVADCGSRDFFQDSFEMRDFRALPLEKQVKEVERLWRRAVARLLVFDNCNELELLKEKLPPNGGCRVLVTSTKTDWGSELLLDILEVPPLKREEDLMRHDRGKWTTEELLNQLNSGDGIDRLALELLSAVARLSPGRPIPHQFLLDFASMQQENLHHQGVTALRRLHDIGLVQFHENSVLIESPIATMVREHENRHEKETGHDFESRIASFLQRTIRDWNETVPGADTIPERTLIVDIITQLEECETPQFAKLFHSFGLQLMGSGSLSIARPFLKRAISIWEKESGPESSMTAQGLQSLGELLQRQGDYTGARACYERALKIRRRALGHWHPHVAQTLNSLGLLSKQQGDLPGARWNYCRALVIRRRAYGRLHRDVAQTLNNLGVLAREMGDFESARKLHEETLKIRETILGQDHPDRAQSLHNLGAALALLGDSEKAQTYFENALSLRTAAFGSEHSDVADTLFWMGYLLERKGDREGASRHYENAQAIYEEILGPDHPRTVDAKARRSFAKGDKK